MPEIPVRKMEIRSGHHNNALNSSFSINMLPSDQGQHTENPKEMVTSGTR